jgi:type II secretory ATPase GspE/PulE/Tfp pilus assembly ATPase PilB-like protein
MTVETSSAPRHAVHHELDLLNADKLSVDPNLALRVPANLALRRLMLPFAMAEKKVLVACADPNDRAGLEAIERYLAAPVLARRAEIESLKRALARVYPDPAVAPIRAGGAARAPEADDDAIGITDEILRFAVLRQASDIHLEPRRDILRIRLRVDGQLEELRRIPASRASGLISRLKVLSGMDIAEKRAPQDGAFTWSSGTGRDRPSVDIRAASVPVKHGERMTLRLLNQQAAGLTLEKLGMSRADMQSFGHAIASPHGMLLINGPTGSGKSTTLYAAIREMDRDKLNIVTVEEPVEYEMEDISQVSVDTAEKITYAKALRSVLRHDPDVVMIGEIRDLDIADVAIKAGLSGHLVLSTLHTNSAPGAITRLIDMGVQPYLVAATLRLSAAQRLVRRLCADCRVARPLARPEAVALGVPQAAGQTIYQPAGCPLCANRGYAGRIGVYEIMVVDEELTGLISSNASEQKIREVAVFKGMRSLRQDAAEKVLAGITSVNEAIDHTDGPAIRK